MSEYNGFIEGGSLADDSQNYLGELKDILVFLGRLGPGKLLLKVPQEVLLLCAGFGLQSKMTLTCC